MNIGDIIQLLMLIASTVAIIVSAVMSKEAISASMKMVKEQNHIQMFAEYTKRYQEIIMKMPNGVHSDIEEPNNEAQKYMQLYFNLCSEEYDLHVKNAISDDVWGKWLAGMRITMKQQTFLCSWKELRSIYATDFVKFFDGEVIDKGLMNR